MRQPCRRHKTRAQVGHRNLGSHMCPHTMLAGKRMESRCSVNSISIQQGHSRHIELYGALDQIFRQGSAFKKTECAGRMKLHIAFSHTALQSASVPA